MSADTVGAVGQRRIGLDGAPNFRDLGGYRNGEGRVVRHGQVYRSDALTWLTDRDLGILRELGIGLVIDVRSAHEKHTQPSRWHAGSPPEVLSCDIDADLRAGTQPLISILRARPDREGARAMLRTTYAVMPAAFAGHLAGLFARLARSDCPPAVLHCTVGKDRTGFVAAMLLFALGMPREVVYEDYLHTARVARNPRLEETLGDIVRSQVGREPDAAMLDALFGVEAEYLDAALRRIDQEYGSVDRYLRVAGGLDDDTRAGLQARLLA
ncbi:tyrosine-protein phosphatase [Aromatoleum toluclasticum]|uniref:tyrosine-protein phosphatase n=1 Tax=Aromatoleum toluclasticum TaxID=92003 RepID=UPI00036B3842|nr:tyrosine-protein phosphatase [Aromatoleum toluclasticum]